MYMSHEHASPPSARYAYDFGCTIDSTPVWVRAKVARVDQLKFECTTDLTATAVCPDHVRNTTAPHTTVPKHADTPPLLFRGTDSSGTATTGDGLQAATSERRWLWITVAGTSPTSYLWKAS